MKIPDEVLKTVAFIAYRDQRDGRLVPVGSVFFLGTNPIGGSTTANRVVAVTARHVIDGLKSLGCETSILRLNPIDLDKDLIEIAIPIGKWKFHPSDALVDVAVVEQGIPAGADHKVIPFNMGADAKKFEEHDVELGDEVFSSGLFVHHFGARRNIPIVRIGNLAALNEEKVQTKSGLIDAYLIESRSIGGLSGSPVFLNLGTSRLVRGKHVISGGSPIYFLLGLIHGHFDILNDPTNNLTKDISVEDTARNSVNAGIAIVVPFEKILEVATEALKHAALTLRPMNFAANNLTASNLLPPKNS